MLTKKFGIYSSIKIQSHKDEPIACPDEDDLKEMDNLSIGFYKLRLLTAN